MSIKTLLDISSLSLEEVTGRLKAQEDRMDNADSNRDSGKLLYADVPRQRDRESGEGLSTTGGNRSQRQRPLAPKKKAVEDGEARKPSRDDTCHNCGLFMTQVCVENHSEEQQTELFSVQEAKKVVGKVNKAAVEYSGDHGVDCESTPLPTMTATTTTCIEEPQAQAYLGEGGEDELMEGWYLDIGATNHMTGRNDVFSHLGRAMRGSVNFGDGSVVAIHGCGTVIFSGRNGEHKALDGGLLHPKAAQLHHLSWATQRERVQDPH
jgi:hypothetical protein